MATPLAVETPVVPRRTQPGDMVARWVVTLFAAVILLVTSLIVYKLWVGSEASRLKSGFGFLTSTQWNPVTEEFGALPFIYGTVVTSVLALLISIPLGLGAAIYLAELAPARVSNGLTFLVELLAAIPSVIYGLLGFFTVVPLMRLHVEPFLKSILGFLPFFKGPSFGVGFLTAGVVYRS